MKIPSILLHFLNIKKVFNFQLPQLARFLHLILSYFWLTFFFCVIFVSRIKVIKITFSITIKGSHTQFTFICVLFFCLFFYKIVGNWLVMQFFCVILIYHIDDRWIYRLDRLEVVFFELGNRQIKLFCEFLLLWLKF